MKIVMVGPFGLRARGTMSVRALPLARALVRRGHRVTLLLPPWQEPEDAGRTWDEAGVTVENLPLPVGVPGWFHLRLTGALVRRALALHPDVIHVFKPKAYAGLVHWELAQFQPRVPVVVDTDDWEGPGGWNDLQPYAPPLKRFFTWQERWGLTHARAVTVASRALQALTWALGGDPDRVFYLPNGVEVPESVGTEKLPAGRPTLLLYTRFFEFDLQRLWRIVARIREVSPKVRLWVIGKGFFEEEKKLLTLAREAGWQVAESTQPAPEADLVYAGWVPAGELPGQFAQADVALYPFDDTLINRTKCPVKLLDLLAAGIPVVGEAVGQVAETLAPQGVEAVAAGVLVPSGDEEAFVAAVLALLADDERRRMMGVQAARIARERFSWDRLAESAEAAYAFAGAGKAW
jgi:glycosyltransferase involved in cell wall biosynthesis